MAYKDVTPPAGGKISILNGKLIVPDNPILPFIRGDGTGPMNIIAPKRRCNLRRKVLIVPSSTRVSPGRSTTAHMNFLGRQRKVGDGKAIEVA
jgi:hypothetical protein